MDTRPSATLRRRFDAPVARVFSAWTDPVKLGKWFGPERVVEAVAEADVRVGGRFRVRLTTRDGERHEVGGVYREIVPDEKLVFTWAWHSTPERESLVTVRLKPDGEGTVLILTHEQLFDDASRDRHIKGWTGSFEKLAAFLA